MNYFLKKSEILRGRHQFKEILDTGLVIKTRNFKIFFKILDVSREIPLVAGFSINRQLRVKVLRNRVRRIMKEFFRLNKGDLISELKNHGKSLKIVFFYRNNDENVAKRVNLGILSGELNKLFKELFLKVNK